MRFLKQNRKYFTAQLQGNISNLCRIQLKDLFDAEKVQNFQTCPKCNALESFNTCIFCGNQTHNFVDQIQKRNFVTCKIDKTQNKKLKSIILCIDMSESMSCTYESKFQKINKDYIVRFLGLKNFNIIAGIITEAEVIKNFKGIQFLYNSGESIKSIAYSLKDDINREKQIKHQKKISNANSNCQPNHQKNFSSEPEYISRKQIIEIGLSRYINQLEIDQPETLITVVYFNNHIEIPIQDFTDKLSILDLENKTLDQIISEGEFYAELISIQSVAKVGEKLIQNMTKTQPTGQTALTPALAFSLGLARKFKHDFHQIILVTDGLSNVGFGQTEDQYKISESKQDFKNLALEYAIPNSCVVNVICFQDCAIGYEAIDQIISRTCGIPYQISFSQHNNQKIVSKQTIDYLESELIIEFFKEAKHFCHDTRIAIKASNKSIKISCKGEYKNFVKSHHHNLFILDLGIRPSNDKWDFIFSVQDQNFEDEFIKFTVIAQYRKKNRVFYAIREDVVSVRKGSHDQAIKDQSKALARQISKKLQPCSFQEENFDEFKEIQEKISQNVQISEQIDENLIKVFRNKKQKIEEQNKNIDKLSKDKRSMMSRRYDTYKRRQPSCQQGEDDEDGFL